MAPELAPAVLVGRQAIVSGKVTIECGHDAEELVILGHIIFLRRSCIWKVAFFPGVDSTQMRPPCISTICLVMASPSPVPPFALVGELSTEIQSPRHEALCSVEFPPKPPRMRWTMPRGAPRKASRQMDRRSDGAVRFPGFLRLCEWLRRGLCRLERGYYFCQGQVERDPALYRRQFNEPKIFGKIRRPRCSVRAR